MNSNRSRRLGFSDQRDVFRVITKAKWLDAGKPTKAAFVLRESDTDGLSISLFGSFPALHDAIHDHIELVSGLTRPHALFSHTTGQIRSLHEQLDVIADSDTHANITGLPIAGETADEAECEKLATALAEAATPRWYRRHEDNSQVRVSLLIGR